MLQLPLVERLIFISVVLVYLAAAIVAIRQLSSESKRSRLILISLIALGVCLQALMMIFRAVAIEAFPLTGLFESMVFLSIVFGIAFLFLSIVISQIWFSSVMTWVMLFIVLLGAKVAAPAAEVHESAKTPWAIAHGLAMTMSAAMIAFSTASAWLFLVAHKRLKNKEVMKVVGRMPNVEKLRQMNAFGIEACFVLVSFGLFTGLGLAAVQIRMSETTLGQWLIDPKIILMTAAWVLLGTILALRFFMRLSAKATAYLTMIACFLIIFAIVGVTIFCGTKHTFSGEETTLISGMMEIT